MVSKRPDKKKVILRCDSKKGKKGLSEEVLFRFILKSFLVNLKQIGCLFLISGNGEQLGTDLSCQVICNLLALSSEGSCGYYLTIIVHRPTWS